MSPDIGSSTINLDDRLHRRGGFIQFADPKLLHHIQCHVQRRIASSLEANRTQQAKHRLLSKWNQTEHRNVVTFGKIHIYQCPLKNQPSSSSLIAEAKDERIIIAIIIFDIPKHGVAQVECAVNPPYIHGIRTLGFVNV